MNLSVMQELHAGLNRIPLDDKRLIPGFQPDSVSQKIEHSGRLPLKLITVVNDEYYCKNFRTRVMCLMS